jgi:hypothetical protein
MEEAHNGEAGRIMVHVIMGHPHVMSPSVTPTHVINENVDFRFIFPAAVRRSLCFWLIYMTPYVQLATYAHD